MVVREVSCRRSRGFPGWCGGAAPLRRDRRRRGRRSPLRRCRRDDGSTHSGPIVLPVVEYWQCSKVTIGVLSGTRRVTPSAAVCGRSGTACSAGRSWVSISTGTPTRGAVHAGIDLDDERRACRFHLGEGAVLRQQVRLGGHDVGFGEFDGVLHPTFGCRVGGFTGQHRDAVVATEGDGCAVADRDPGDVSGGDGLLVVGEQVGRGAAQDAEDPVQSGEDTGCGAVPQRRSRPGIGTTPTTPPDSTTLRPATSGPSPKSYCSHSPGSVIQGRCTRVLPSRHWDLISASARRVVRSVPVYPSASSRSWALSPRIFPFESATHPSRTSRQSSIIRARRVAGGKPASRSSTAFFTVWCEQPHSSAAAR